MAMRYEEIIEANIAAHGRDYFNANGHGVEPHLGRRSGERAISSAARHLDR